ncbi:MAG: hypothetical protein U5Q03_10850 [Bacteroidota bacterium]|nr:hypothetical protein [Bacteroidota bacterium]
MNINQRTIIEKVIKGKESDILNEMLDFFLDKGLGSVSKTEIDIYLFYILEKYQRSQKARLSNYEWSSLLKISERRIKNLRLESGIRYKADDDDDDFQSWIGVLELITEGYLEFEGNEKIILTIENPYLVRFIEHNLKKLKLSSTDYSFNSERVKLKISSLTKLLQHGEYEIGLSKNTSKAQEKLQKAKWKNYTKETAKKVFDILAKAVPKLAKGLIAPGS